MNKPKIVRKGGLRPASTQELQPRTEYETTLGENILTKDFANDLREFYAHANSEDRRKCLQLISTLSPGEQLAKEATPSPPITPKTRFQRPRTAMASLGHSNRRPHTPGSEREVKRTVTTYRRDFPGKIPDKLSGTARPSTTDAAYRANHGPTDQVGSPTYRSEYYNKGYCRPDTIRSGTASGQRRNNPHPFKSFIVWRLPKNVPENQKTYPTLLTDQMMEEVLRDKCQSTYDSDYLGIPKGFQMTSAFDKYSDFKEDTPYSLDSSMRFSYQYPKQQNILSGPTTRFGCNKTKHVPTTGIVPTTSRYQMHLHKLTTYDHFFNNQMKPKMRELQAAFDAGKLGDYVRSADEKDRDLLIQAVRSLTNKHSNDKVHSKTGPLHGSHGNPRPKSSMCRRPKSSATSQRSRTFTPDLGASKGMSHISSWTGPT
ncbi:uncharacterized protein [Apostichopus japonicus]|uniref:uncharacterized protein n=1 Tax=Stichopus japonicus TaxID=307972 RepID=UPI003AB3B795